MVIAIIAMLAGLLLPAVHRAKNEASTAVCLGNLKQWGLATQLYVGENDDFLPPEGFPNPTGISQLMKGWYFHLPQTIRVPPYLEMSWRTNAEISPGRTLWLCPSNLRRSNGNNLFHYCLNENHDGTGANDKPARLSSFTRPAAIVWLFDSKNLPAVGTPNFVHTNLHSQGANFTFLDGHARRFKSVEYWDAKASRGRTNNPDLVWVP